MKCTKCKLWTGVNHVGVPGRGDEKPLIFFIGQAPGQTEDGRNECFVGKAGNKLMRTVRSKRLYEFGVRYDNTVKCYPPRDRKPRKVEVEACVGYVQAEIKKYKPWIVVPLGSTALMGLTSKKSIRRWGGHAFTEDGQVYFPILHPSAAMRQEKDDRVFQMQFDALRGLAESLTSMNHASGVDYKVVTTIDGIMLMIGEIEDTKVISFDIETTGINPQEPGAEIVGISFSHKLNHAYYVDLDQFDKKYEKQGAITVLKAFLSENNSMKFAHQVKFELKWLRHHWDCVVKNYQDTVLIDHLLHCERAHWLKCLAYMYSNIGGYDGKMIEWQEKGGAIHKAPKEVLYPYACGDSDCTRQIGLWTYRMLSRYPKLLTLYTDMSLPYADVLAKMELRGLYVNRDALRKVRRATIDRQRRILKDIHEDKDVKELLKEFGSLVFNPNSNKQVQKLLFEQLGLSTDRTTKAGNQSTDSDALDELAKQHPVANMIKEYRVASHNQGVAEDLGARLLGDDTVRCNFRQDVVVSGRLASQNPNLQNLSRDGRIMGCFESRFEGGTLLHADFSQDHVRILVNLCHDPDLLRTLERNEGIYESIGSRIYNKDPKEIKGEERELSKHMTLGCIFGIGAKTLSGKAMISYQRAQKLLNLFFTKFPRIDDLIKGFRREAKEHGAAASVLGRFRRLPELTASDNRAQYHALLQAGNFPIQAFAADAKTWTIVQIEAEMRKRELDSIIINEQHDSILFDCAPGEKEEVEEIARYYMEERTFVRFGYWLTVPMKADITEGSTWATTKG